MEVIIAVAIVSIMAGALAPVIYHEINMARSAATSRELDLLKDGLLDFYEDTGRFPAEALQIMEELTITSLPVVDGAKRLLGVIQIHDLWRTELF